MSIDTILQETWRQAGVQPAAMCGDLAFLRRITLDLAGRTPTLAEIHAFEAAPDRAAKIDALLISPEFPRFWSELWTAMLNGYAPNVANTDREALRLWLESQLAQNRPYDEMATQLVTATGPSTRDGSVNFVARYGEDASVRVSRMFLGVRLDCARCHDHPFDRWKKQDFASMTRFFAATQRQGSEGNPMLIDGVGGDPKPVFLTGTSPRSNRWRDEFALMMTSTNAFAKTFANRMWYLLMGRGIVDPPDDFNAENPPKIPALLDYLAGMAKDTGWDLRALVREIAMSQAYQLDSAPSDAKAEAFFAVHAVKPMTIEQLLNSMHSSLGWRAKVSREDQIRQYGRQLAEEDFSSIWKYRETVQQVMSRLALDLPAPAAETEGIYLRILGRRPASAEVTLCEGRSPGEIAFALVNSNEFNFNH